MMVNRCKLNEFNLILIYSNLILKCKSKKLLKAININHYSGVLIGIVLIMLLLLEVKIVKQKFFYSMKLKILLFFKNVLINNIKKVYVMLV